MNTKSLRFTKMQGLGNDFMVIDAVNQDVDLSHLPISTLADRHTGVGFDQLLVIEPGLKADFYCRIFNADGSEAEQCGNGLRCVARFIHEERLHTHPAFTIATKAGVFPVNIPDYNHVQITMGSPHIIDSLTELTLTSAAHTIPLSILSVGNPHAIVKVNAITPFIIDQWGPEISKHARFPAGVNVGFMQIIDNHHIRLRTFERGAGETLACGSNACAAAVAGIENGWLQEPVQVEFACGSLSIQWDKRSGNINMTGPAARVFEGVVNV